MSNEIQEVTATVFKQYSLKWLEVGKSALLAGISAALALIGASIEAGRMPTSVELITAGKVGIAAMIAALLRYFFNATTTVIKGQVEPLVKVSQPTQTAVVKESAPLPSNAPNDAEIQNSKP